MPVDPEIARAVTARLGSTFDELIEVMNDLATHAIFLNADDRPRLVKVRSRAHALLRAWESENRVRVQDLVARLPEVLQGGSAIEALLEGATWDACSGVSPDVLELPKPNSRVLTAIPDLAGRMDNDGLVDVAGLDARPHGLVVDGYALHYHQLLRRGFQANIHYGLVGLVLDLADRFDLRARLALDDRRLRLREEYEEYEERDYWYGPSFDDACLDDVREVGETYYGDPSGGGSIMNPYAGLSVRWSADESLKTVQVEEFLPLPVQGQEWVLARYLHAIRDTTRHSFIHCDGAVKAYDSASYPAVQREFAIRGRGDRYRKVFRLDGAFPTDAWSQLLAAWFRGNTLALEYLHGREGE